jgi:predicted nucleic acid binding AN1-type Zn finger protein
MCRRRSCNVAKSCKVAKSCNVAKGKFCTWGRRKKITQNNAQANVPETNAPQTNAQNKAHNKAQANDLI